MKILLAVDGSPRSDSAVEEVSHRPWPAGTEIKVLSVAESVPLGLVGIPVTYFTALIDPVSAASQAAVTAAVRKLNEAFEESIEVHGAIVVGSPKHVIVEEADRWGADLIVVGSYGHSALERLLIGSIPQSLILHAHCSVEVVRSTQPVSL